MMIVCLLCISNSTFPTTSRQSSHRCRCSGRVQRCSYVKQLSHAARQLAASIHFNGGRAAERRRQKRLLPCGRVCPPPTDFHSQCPNGIEWGYAYFMKCFEWRFLLSRPTWNSASIKWLKKIYIYIFFFLGRATWVEEGIWAVAQATWATPLCTSLVVKYLLRSCRGRCVEKCACQNQENSEEIPEVGPKPCRDL